MEQITCEACPQHSGVEARLVHLEEATGSQWRKLDKMDERTKVIERRFTQILIMIITVLLGVIATYIKA
jgi:hypothetical protein